MIGRRLNGNPPLTIAQQPTCTFVNRSAANDDKRRLVKVTLRAVPKKYGKQRFDNIKLAVVNEAEQTRMYFARFKAPMLFKNAILKCTSCTLLK